MRYVEILQMLIDSADEFIVIAMRCNDRKMKTSQPTIKTARLLLNAIVESILIVHCYKNLKDIFLFQPR